MSSIALIIMTACAAAGAPVGHRIGTRPEGDGIHGFYDRVTGESFYPAGFTHIGLNDAPSSSVSPFLFNAEHGDLERANRTLAFMAAYGYNTVRVPISVFEAFDANGEISSVYLDNLALFLRRVRDQGMQALLVLPMCIPVGCPENADVEYSRDSDGLLPSNEAVILCEARLKEFVSALRDAGAPINALFGYELCVQHCADEVRLHDVDGQATTGADLVVVCNRMAAAIKSVGSDALVGVGLFPPEPPPSVPGLSGAVALFQSDLDYINLLYHPDLVMDDGVAYMDALFEGAGITGMPDKPLMMTGLEFRNVAGSLDNAASAFETCVVAAKKRGVRGWMLPAYDWLGQARPPFEEACPVADVGETCILRALAPPLPDSSPSPRPIKTSARVGVYIFPGWYRNTGTTDYDYSNHDEESEWRLIAEFAHPRPVLGFYDDSLPEVNDWHIHWAIEAGISWFAFDWYWNAGETRLIWSLEKGFLEADYNEQMDFCIHWCNHGLDWREPLDFSSAALVEMVTYMVEHYFTRPNYLTIDGRPVLMIWDIMSVFEANGGEEAFAEQVLPRLNAICHDHGLEDLYLIHVHNAPQMLAAVRTGDAITGYSYAHLTTTTPFGLPGSAPYAELVEALPGHWDMIMQRAQLPFIVGTQSGWDSTPRTLAHNRQPQHRWVRTNNTTELFKVTLEEGRKRISDDLPFFLIEAWNEWGEGSFIEPSRSHGFGHLEAIRNVFAPDAPPGTWRRPGPEQVTAYSVLQGEELAAAHRREQKPDPPVAVWEPQVDVSLNPQPLAGRLIEEWVLDSEDAVNALPFNAAMRFDGIHDNAARFTVVGDDPHIVFEDGWDVPAANCAIVLEVRYRGVSPLPAEFFWALDGEGFVSHNAQRYNWQTGETFHTYALRFRPTEKTHGMLTGFRIDLPDEMDAETDLRRIRLLSFED